MTRLEECYSQQQTLSAQLSDAKKTSKKVGNITNLLKRSSMFVFEGYCKHDTQELNSVQPEASNAYCMLLSNYGGNITLLVGEKLCCVNNGINVWLLSNVLKIL